MQKGKEYHIYPDVIWLGSPAPASASGEMRRATCVFPLVYRVFLWTRLDMNKDFFEPAIDFLPMHSRNNLPPIYGHKVYSEPPPPRPLSFNNDQTVIKPSSTYARSKIAPSKKHFHEWKTTLPKNSLIRIRHSPGTQHSSPCSSLYSTISCRNI